MKWKKQSKKKSIHTHTNKRTSQSWKKMSIISMIFPSSKFILSRHWFSPAIPYHLESKDAFETDNHTKFQLKFLFILSVTLLVSTIFVFFFLPVEMALTHLSSSSFAATFSAFYQTNKKMSLALVRTTLQKKKKLSYLIIQFNWFMKVTHKTVNSPNLNDVHCKTFALLTASLICPFSMLSICMSTQLPFIFFFSFTIINWIMNIASANLT